MHPASDIDLAVLFRHVPESYAGLAGLEADLQVLVPEREVVLGVLNHADPLFLKQVMAHALDALAAVPQYLDRINGHLASSRAD